MKNFPILLNSARQLWEKNTSGDFLRESFGIGIRCFCFLSGQSPAPTGERWCRSESALRLGPQSLAYPSSNRKTWHPGAVFVWLRPLCAVNESSSGAFPGKDLGIGIRCLCFLSGQSPARTGERRRRPESVLRLMSFCPWPVHPVSERHDIRERSLCDRGRSIHSMDKAPGLPREKF